MKYFIFKVFMTLTSSAFIIWIIGQEPSILYFTLIWLIPVTILIWSNLLKSYDSTFFDKFTGIPSQNPKKRN